jgi:hypothetical protein
VVIAGTAFLGDRVAFTLKAGGILVKEASGRREILRIR